MEVKHLKFSTKELLAISSSDTELSMINDLN